VIDKKFSDATDPFSPIASTTVKITYYVEGDSPEPELFIKIQENDWMVEVYKGDVLDFKGFIRPDQNSYPWIAKPFTFTINAVDFTFCKGTIIDLDDVNLFLYDFITFADFFKRTLFKSIGYDDPVLKVCFNIRPSATGLSNILTNLILHTDAFYNFDTGALYAYDCLELLLKSIGARMFFSAGSYWLVRVFEIGDETQDILVLKPGNIGDPEVFNDTLITLGEGLAFGMSYYDKTQELSINKALKQRTYKYNLKAINQIKNFDWRTNLTSPFTDWEGDISNFYQRVGTGTLDDQFRLKIGPKPSGSSHQIWSRVDVKINQLFQIDVKIKAFLTLPEPDLVNYQVFGKVVVVLVSAGNTAPIRKMDGSGAWQEIPSGNVGEADMYHISASPVDDQFGTLSIQSEPIPEIPGVPNLQVLFIITDAGITPAAPDGSVFYIEMYPVFGRVFNRPYVSLIEKIVSDKNFSYIASDDDRFFADTLDAGFSNTIFYDLIGTKQPIPSKNWTGNKTIDETVVRGELDQQYMPNYTFTGTVLSNQLSFHHCVLLTDKDNIKMMQMDDSYSVKSGLHTISLIEKMEEGSGNGTYTVLPKLKST
jgi:hypothetical protein